MPENMLTGEERFRQLVKQYVRPTDHVLDLGCGAGEFTIELASLAGKVTGVDVSRHQIERAKNRLRESDVTNVSFAHTAGQDLVFPEDAFDAVVSRYGPLGLTSFLDEARRVIKSGGIFIEVTIGDDDAPNVRASLSSDAQIRPGKKQRLQERLTTSGFRVERLEDVYVEKVYDDPVALARVLSQTVSDVRMKPWAEQLKRRWHMLSDGKGILFVKHHWLVWVAYNEK